MTTNTPTDVERSGLSSQIYLPATPGTGGGPVERFVTGLYETHRRLTRRLE